MAATVFSKIIAGEIPATILYDDDEILAFRDIAPQAPTHVLVIPKREIPTVADCEEGDATLLGRMILVANRIAREEGIDEKGYRLVVNCRDEGGQEVPHLHIHLLGGRAMGWPPG